MLEYKVLRLNRYRKLRQDGSDTRDSIHHMIFVRSCVASDRIFRVKPPSIYMQVTLFSLLITKEIIKFRSGIIVTCRLHCRHTPQYPASQLKRSDGQRRPLTTSTHSTGQNLNAWGYHRHYFFLIWIARLILFLFFWRKIKEIVNYNNILPDKQNYWRQ